MCSSVGTNWRTVRDTLTVKEWETRSAEWVQSVLEDWGLTSFELQNRRWRARKFARRRANILRNKNPTGLENSVTSFSCPRLAALRRPENRKPWSPKPQQDPKPKIFDQTYLTPDDVAWLRSSAGRLMVVVDNQTLANLCCGNAALEVQLHSQVYGALQDTLRLLMSITRH